MLNSGCNTSYLEFKIAIDSQKYSESIPPLYFGGNTSHREFSKMIYSLNSGAEFTEFSESLAVLNSGRNTSFLEFSKMIYSLNSGAEFTEFSESPAMSNSRRNTSHPEFNTMLDSLNSENSDSGPRVVGCLFRDLHVVGVALAEACTCDAHEVGLLQGVDVGCAYITHRCL